MATVHNNLTVGKTYAVTTAGGCTITDEGGNTVKVVAANSQGVFVAQTPSVILSDDNALFTLVFNSALALDGNGGGGSITVDPEPTQGSNNAVSSGGVYTALQGKQDALTAGDGITLSGGTISVNANGAVNSTDTKPVSGQTVNAAIAAAIIGAGGAALDGNNTFTATNTFSGAVALNGTTNLTGSVSAEDAELAGSELQFYLAAISAFAATSLDLAGWKGILRSMDGDLGTRIPAAVGFPAALDANSVSGYQNPLFSTGITALPDNWLFPNLVSGRVLFSGCSSLTHLPEGMTFASVTDAWCMFSNCSSLTHLPEGMTFGSLRGNAEQMFSNCSSLTHLPDGMTFANVTSAASAFSGCSSLTHLPDGFSVSSMKAAIRMFEGCSLDKASVLRVLGSLPSPPPPSTEWGAGKISIGKRTLWATDPDVATALGITLEEGEPIPAGTVTAPNGWSVTVQS